MNKASDFRSGGPEAVRSVRPGVIDRRGFLDRAARFAVGGVTAAMLLDALNRAFAEAQQVPADDKRLNIERVEYDSPQGYGKMKGYLVRPAKAKGKQRAVLVVHENRGLNPHIEDRGSPDCPGGLHRLRPDALFPGWLSGQRGQGRELFAKLDQAKTSGTSWPRRLTEERPTRTGKDRRGRLLLWGRHVQHAGHARARPGAAGPFYGGQAPVEDVPKIKSAAHDPLCERGRALNAGAGVRGGAEGAQGELQAFIYPGTQHGFNNDTTPATTRPPPTSPGSARFDFFKQEPGVTIGLRTSPLPSRAPRGRGQIMPWGIGTRDGSPKRIVCPRPPEGGEGKGEGPRCSPGHRSALATSSGRPVPCSPGDWG
jgi:carboxymethylenebutenolidase